MGSQALFFQRNTRLHAEYPQIVRRAFSYQLASSRIALSRACPGTEEQMSGRLLKHFMQIAGILVLAGLNVQSAQDSRPSDVTIYVNGDDFPPVRIDYGARATVTRMYAPHRHPPRLARRRSGKGHCTRQPGAHPDAVCQQRPRECVQGGFGVCAAFCRWGQWHHRHLRADSDGHRRIDTCRGRLAHVLAHEIAHMLIGTDWHAETGIMKAHWDGTDYAAMKELNPLEFTPDDVDMIIKGLSTWKSQNAGEHSRP